VSPRESERYETTESCCGVFRQSNKVEIELERMRRLSTSARNINVDLESGTLGPVIHQQWWKEHVRYSTFNREGIDIFCASFVNPKAHAKVVFVTGWNESFLKYAELIKTLFESGLSVFTYDHQSQGLSGRWLMDEQATWIYNFDAYVLDFVFYVNNMIEGATEETAARKAFHEARTGDTPTKGKPSSESQDTKPKLPLYAVAHSMGGLIIGIACAKYPNLVRRMALSAPAFRFKCGMKALDYRGPMPLPVAYAINWAACYMGMGQSPLLGFFHEDPKDPVTKQLSSCDEQLELQRQLRMKHPSIISCCGTFDWCLHSFDAQAAFANVYNSVRTNCLIFKAENAESDVFVHNRAIDAFAASAYSTKLFDVPGAKHEVLLEAKATRAVVYETIVEYFKQDSDSITGIIERKPLKLRDPKASLHITWKDMLLRSTGALVATVGILTGVTIMVMGRGRRR